MWRVRKVDCHDACPTWRGLIAATSFKSSDYVQMAAKVAPDVPSLTEVVFIGTAKISVRSGEKGNRATLA